MEGFAEPTRVFIHGLDSSGRGTKGAFFKEKYPDMIVEDYRGSFEERMAGLDAVLQDKDELIIIGSSYGGLMAAVYACRTKKKVRRLILLAPALNHMPSEACANIELDLPVVIYHGRRDDVVPPGPVYEIARKMFTDLTYLPVDDDHSLHRTFETIDWNSLLGAT